jgi:hypothetical protein
MAVLHAVKGTKGTEFRTKGDVQIKANVAFSGHWRHRAPDVLHAKKPAGAKPEGAKQEFVDEREHGELSGGNDWWGKIKIKIRIRIKRPRISAYFLYSTKFPTKVAAKFAAKFEVKFGTESMIGWGLGCPRYPAMHVDSTYFLNVLM